MAVRCGSCGRELDEGENTPVEGRTPCPDCGSLTRRYERTFEGNITPQGEVSVVVNPATIEAHATVPPPTIVLVGTAEEHDEALPIVPLVGVSPDTFDALIQVIRGRRPDHVRTLCITDLADGTFVAEVLDEKGDVLAQGLGDDEEDAILELAEALKRPDASEE